MKRILLLLLTLVSLQIFSQAPEKLNYQAIARAANGNALTSQTIKLRLTVKDGSATGTIVYQETDTATTNQFGLFTTAIGAGTPTSGTFSNIDWSTGDKFLQVEFDPNGGNTFTDMGTTELLSVPYALYAETSGDASAGAWSDYAVYSETRTNNLPPQTTLIDSVWVPRKLNTTEASAGTAITRTGQNITLEAGTYHISASAQWGLTVTQGTAGNIDGEIYARGLLNLSDTTGNLYLLGQAEFHSFSYKQTLMTYIPIQSYPAIIEGVITVPTTATFTLQHLISYPKINGDNSYQTYTNNAGIPISIGQDEIYSRILIHRID